MGIRGHIPQSADDGQGLDGLRTSQDVIGNSFSQVWGTAYLLRNFPKEPLRMYKFIKEKLALEPLPLF